jgi:hypothetical protein
MFSSRIEKFKSVEGMIPVMHDDKTFDAARECLGFERPVPLVKELYPVTLYHVSINKEAVCREGLKAIVEINPRRLVQGIGGYQFDSVSFSYDLSFVKGYAKDVLMMAKVANGALTPAMIEAYLDKNDPVPGMKMKPSGIFRKIANGTDIPENRIGVTAYTKIEPREMSSFAEETMLGRRRRRSRENEPGCRVKESQEHVVSVYKGMLDDLKQGRILDKKSIYYYIKKLPPGECITFLKEHSTIVKAWDNYTDSAYIRSIDKVLKFGKDAAEICKNATEDDLDIYTIDDNFPDDYRKLPTIEQQSILFNLLYWHYFKERQANGGRQDPYFFRVGFEDYVKIKPGNIGLFKVLAYIPKPMETYLASKERNIDDEYPEHLEEGLPKQSWEIGRKDHLMIAKYEKEVRIPPKYTTRLEEIPM